MHPEISNCRVQVGGADMDDRLECKFNNYNGSTVLGEENIVNLQLALEQNGISLTTGIVVAGSSADYA